MVKRNRSHGASINNVPTRSSLHDDVDAFSSRRRKKTNLKSYLYGDNSKNFDIPIATFDRMK